MDAEDVKGLCGPEGFFGFGFTEVELDFFQERGEKLFFLQADVDVFPAIDGAVAGNDDNGHLRVLFVDVSGQLEAVHTFHAEISYEDVEFLAIEFLESFLGVEGADGLIALHFQDLATEASKNLVIVDEEDSFHGGEPSPQKDRARLLC